MEIYFGLVMGFALGIIVMVINSRVYNKQYYSKLSKTVEYETLISEPSTFNSRTSNYRNEEVNHVTKSGQRNLKVISNNKK
ncbi:hypothetical protein HME9304_00188 [Flagellimonas maritima]|uniref:Uncharacterized protein n=1 Tax=Flagellimonas maritima TaxID=1383885 RepID=A0A2Z4LMZ4_9FLAO|nr:hypothetical protein [Allomuricauda aurantiaca]AWX43201.1 hypothetical protein HME9304_00188 [Allomuricauda aurantiaca]